MNLNYKPCVVTSAKAGVHGLLDPRLRGGDDMGASQLYRILL